MSLVAESKTTAARPPGAVQSGVLVVNKPAGWTSHDVVAKVRGMLRAGRSTRLKVGHLGTLDPEATGVLPLCIGKATKIAQYLAGTTKHYRAVMKLGERTDTQDATGRVMTSTPPAAVTRHRVEAVCEKFLGPISQVPPMYSAVKVDGRPLYRAARAGLEVARSPRTVVIGALRVTEMDGPFVTLDIECSKGTYVRTLCADMGDMLGVGAHLYRLERRRVGDFTLEGAVMLEQVEEAVRSGTVASFMTPMDRLLPHLPEIIVDRQTAERVAHGVPFSGQAAPGPLMPGQPVRVISAGQGLIAIGRVQRSGARGTAAGEAPLHPADMTIRIDTVVIDP